MANIDARLPIYREFSLGGKGCLVFLDMGTSPGFFSFYSALQGGSCYLVPGDMLQNFSQTIKHQNIRILGSPNQIIEFQRVVEGDDAGILIGGIVVTGSTLPPNWAAHLEDYFDCKILNLYGSSETGSVSFRSDQSINQFDMGNVIDGVNVEIVDSKGNPTPVGVVGRIRIKAKSPLTGYFKDAKNTKKFFKDGWFYPGDLGHLEDGNRLILDGRKAELVNLGGVKIDPAIMDNFVIGKFGVSDAGTFGYRDAGGLETFGIAIVVSSEFNERQLSQEVANYCGTAFPISLYRVEEIKRNSRGKVMRQEIASNFKIEFGLIKSTVR